MIELFSKEQLGQVDWGKTDIAHAEWMKQFCLGLPKQYIDNVETECRILQTDNALFLVTINQEEYDSSYVCSLYTALILYSKEELARLDNVFLEYPLRGLIACLDNALRLGLVNQVIAVNNFLLSTNLYPSWDGRNIGEITAKLKKEFPNHAIIFRSLTFCQNASLISKFKHAGYYLATSRQIYIFDRLVCDYTQKHNFKMDIKSLKKTQYKKVNHDEITDEDFSRIVELYNKLYIHKYSQYNPKYNEQCMRLWHQSRIMEFWGLRNEEGVLDAVMLCYDRGPTTTVPAVGYDLNLPHGVQLYRMLIARAIERASEKGLVLNLSAGASLFKILRGGVGHIEMSAVYLAHLPLKRRIVWNCLIWLLNHIAAPLMKRYRL